MALHWWIDEIQDYTKVCYDTTEEGECFLKPVTDALIWATLAVGMGEITAKNHIEFYTRLCMVNVVANDWGHPSLHDVRDHIGLRTNVTTLTKAKFDKNIVTQMRADAMLQAERCAAEIDAAKEVTNDE